MQRPETRNQRQTTRIFKSPADISERIRDGARGSFATKDVTKVFSCDPVAGDVGKIPLPPVVATDAPNPNRVNGELVQQGIVLGIDQP